MMKFLLVFVILINILLPNIEACDYVYGSTSEDFFDSHSGYPSSDYNNYIDDCWVIEVPSGYVVRVYADSDFELETSTTCAWDQLRLSCGEDGDEGDIGEYCGTSGPSFVYSDSRYMYVQFETDYSGAGIGFRLYYQAVADPGYSNCGDTDFGDDSSESSSNRNLRRAGRLAVGAIVAIVVVMIVIFIVIPVVIIIIVVCVAKASHKNHVGRMGTGAVYPMSTTVVRNQPVGAAMPPPQYGVAPAAYGNTAYGAGQLNISTMPPQNKGPPPPTYSSLGNQPGNTLPPIAGSQSYPPPPPAPAPVATDPAYPGAPPGPALYQSPPE